MDTQQQQSIEWTNSNVGNKESPQNKQLLSEQKQINYKLLDFLDFT